MYFHVAVLSMFDLKFPIFFRQKATSVSLNISFCLQVCYVCGDEFKKGTLSYIFAKQVTDLKEPFYPSLICHARPARSRPMDSAGRVQTCDKCHDHLLAQWNAFEQDDEEIPHDSR